MAQIPVKKEELRISSEATPAAKTNAGVVEDATKGVLTGSNLISIRAAEGGLGGANPISIKMADGVNNNGAGNTYAVSAVSGANRVNIKATPDAKEGRAPVVKNNGAGKDGVVRGEIMGINRGRMFAFVRTTQFKTDFFVGVHHYRCDLANGDLVSFEFDGEPERSEGWCPRTYNVERIEVATKDFRPTGTMSAHNKDTSASDQSRHNIGTRSSVSNKITSAGVESQSNLKPQLSIETLSKQVEALAKALADLVQAGAAVTRA